MHENDANNSPSQNNDKGNSPTEYIRLAQEAADQGETALSLHLYLAAFEAKEGDSFYPGDAVVKGLRQAWKLACGSEDRSMAEHIFGKLEPYLSAEEIAQYVEQLQQLAFDKLEEVGLNPKNIEDVTRMLSQDFFGTDSFLGALKTDPKAPFSGLMKSALPSGEVSLEEFAKKDSKALVSPKNKEMKESEESIAFPDRPTYQDIVGYHDAIKSMARYGIGMEEDEEFNELVKMLNACHGLEKMPIIDTFLFKSPVREDANHFMMATLGEIDLPAIRMSVEENPQGMPVLCVMAQTQHHPHFNMMNSVFDDGGVLILENIDKWGIPLSEVSYDSLEGLIQAQFSRGAREAINFIRSAVEDPEVYVFASLSSGADIEPFFLNLLDPIVDIDIHYPTSEERVEIWEHVVQRHPSLKHIDRGKLVRCSARLSRFDIYMAAREAVEDAYKESLIERTYKSVSSHVLFEKLAAYQPLESLEYQQLEDAVVEDFRRSITDIDDLLKGSEEH